ncbi:Putative multidrug resistance protein MdtD [uncultured archaeon]|nr:Putative multidrug resistance protein MdtD [uncultured archaeon]
MNIEQNNIPDGYKWTALSVTSLGMLVGILNASTLIIALPTMMVKLNTDLFGIMWVLISYTLLLTILAPAWGRLADIYGRKKLYVYGLAVFTVGSLLCGLSANISQLIAFRVLQAVGGSMLVANGTIIVTDAFRRSELGKAMGILSMIMAAAFVVGPILGGFLTIIDWRLNFFINVPIGIIVTVWAHLKLKDIAVLPKGEKFDLKGMILFTIAFLTSMIYLTAGFVLGLTSPPMLLLLVIAIISFAVFLRIERVATYPLMDLNLFKIRIFSYGQLSALLNSIARGAVMILLILFFQGPWGYDPLTASILTIPLAIGLAITGPIGGVLSDKYGSRIISTVGLIISLIGLLGLATMHYNTPYWILAVWMFINSFGSGLFQPPNTSAIMSAVTPQRRGVASSMRAFFNSAGMVLSMGIAFPLIMGTISITEMMDMFVVGGAHMPVAVQEAFTGGITRAFILSALITVPAIIASAMRGKEDIRKDRK